MSSVGRSWKRATANSKSGRGEEEAILKRQHCPTKVSEEKGLEKDLCRVVVGAWAEISESCWSPGDD